MRHMERLSLLILRFRRRRHDEPVAHAGRSHEGLGEEEGGTEDHQDDIILEGIHEEKSDLVEPLPEGLQTVADGVEPDEGLNRALPRVLPHVRIRPRDLLLDDDWPLPQRIAQCIPCMETSSTSSSCTSLLSGFIGCTDLLFWFVGHVGMYGEQDGRAKHGRRGRQE
eukprot:CAMPEP_0185745710 /NCGR_PEP_ID=MMETSP1174-20130828/4103_1 /TAXON_ID=35687 /ORGANISM="Dictyocha speculum, Strain CCMP1381" /LENGTH=166 /DNA_ID=CAMNT_0028419893 /DNA_START=212 /DNA_END=712 /DNA_ORIENTATION=-